MFFSEEKNQKTFIPFARRTIEAMAGIVGLAQKQKSFSSFLQKRSPSLDLYEPECFLKEGILQWQANGLVSRWA
jgi:hypothetical protein